MVIFIVEAEFSCNSCEMGLGSPSLGGMKSELTHQGAFVRGPCHSVGVEGIVCEKTGQSSPAIGAVIGSGAGECGVPATIIRKKGKGVAGMSSPRC